MLNALCLPSMTLRRVRSRIGDMGLPRLVWRVRTLRASGHVTDEVAFYDRLRKVMRVVKTALSGLS